MFALFSSARRRLPLFAAVWSSLLIAPLAGRAVAAPYVNLGPSDNVAIDQPEVAVALYTQPASGTPQFLGPDSANSFVLDTGSTTILAGQSATSELNSHPGFQTVATYDERGTAGSSPAGVSNPYRFDFAGTNGVPISLPSTRILAAAGLDVGFDGIAGTPLMVGRNTTVDMTTLPTAFSLTTNFAAAPPAAAGHRYDVPLQMVNFPLDGQRNPTDPLPTSAPLSMAPVLLRNGSHSVESHFIVDTGAQLSFFSSATAAALGIDPNIDSIGSIQIGGIGGTVNMPIVSTKSIALHTQQGTDLVWTDLQVGVLDIDPQVAGIVGMDLLTSGWLNSVLGTGGNGYLSHVNFDFRNAANMTGDMLIDVDPGHDVGTSPAFWDYGGNGSFSDATKWNPAVVPGGAGATMTFGNGVSNTVNAPNVTVGIDRAVVAGTLIFNNTQGTGYILGNDGVSGHGITLENGATVIVAAGVSAPQQIQANLLLDNDALFAIAPGGSLQITVGSIIAINETTLVQHGITLKGGGTLIIDTPSSYSGGTTVNSGTLITTPTGTLGLGPLTINAADTMTAVVNLGSNQTVTSLSSALGGSGTARVIVGAETALTVNQSSDTNFAGNVALVAGAAAHSGGALTKSGAGTLEIDGAPSLSNNSNLNVSGGILRLNLTPTSSGSVSVGTGVTAIVSSTAVMELAGSVSALSSGSNRVKIINNSLAAGVLVSGANQMVGAIDGPGSVRVNAGGNLTANRIVQNALIIGGTATNAAKVTIDASDASGNPLAQTSGLALAGSLQANSPYAAGLSGSSSLLGIGDTGGATNGLSTASHLALINNTIVAGSTSVPEPSAMLLLIIGSAACLLTLGRFQARGCST